MGRKSTIYPNYKVVLCGGFMPKQSVEHSAGYDVFVPHDTIVRKGRQVIDLEFKIALPIGVEACMRPRSGFSAKGMEGYIIPRFKWLKPKKKRFDADVLIGTIDHGYHDNVGVIINNHGEPFKIEEGTRIAQIVFSKHESPTLVIVGELDGFDRGGGFGHSRTK